MGKVITGFVLAALSWTAAGAQAAVQSQTVTYEHDGQELQGFLAWSDSVEGPRPGIMVVHEWWGLNDYVKKRARMLAKLGYVAFAADMYGKGRATEHGSEASEWSRQITGNVAHWQARALAGLEVLRGDKRVAADRVADVGYCFGGATVMQMAYSGADVDAVVSFHGSLPVPDKAQAANIRAAIYAAHGSADEFVPDKRVLAFQQALDAAAVDWHMSIHGGARHGFTNPDASKYDVDNIRYDADADRRSWSHMKRFLKETLERKR